MATTTIDVPEGLPYVDITREFNAPRDLIHRAYTDPELLPQWLGPRNLTMTVEKWDIRDGGAWRYVQTDPDGKDWGFHGVFHGPQTPDQMIQTFEFDGVPGHVSFSELKLEEKDGKTTPRPTSCSCRWRTATGWSRAGCRRASPRATSASKSSIARLVPVAS